MTRKNNISTRQRTSCFLEALSSLKKAADNYEKAKQFPNNFKPNRK